MVEFKPNPVRHRYKSYGKDRIAFDELMINYKGNFDMKMVYTLAHEWLCEEGWAERELDQDFPEIYYLQRETSFGKELWIRWRMTKTPEGVARSKDSSLFEFEMDIEFMVLGLKSTEIIVKGQKFKTNKGEVEVRINAGLVFDKGKYFSQNPWLKPVMHTWIKRVINPRFVSLKGEMLGEQYRFREALTTYLQLEKLLGDKEFAEFWTNRSME